MVCRYGSHCPELASPKTLSRVSTLKRNCLTVQFVKTMGLVKSLQIKILLAKGSKQKKMNDVSVLVYACLCCFSPAVGAESVVPVSGGGAQVCKSVLLLVSGGSWKGILLPL